MHSFPLRLMAVTSAASLTFTAGVVPAGAASAAVSNPLTAPLDFPVLSSALLPEIPGTTEIELEDPALAGVAVRDTRHIHDNLYEIDVYSAAMDTVITNEVLLPATDAPRPTLYLMPGSYGGQHEDGTWADATDYESFFADKLVNVVTPVGGDGSLFQNWKDAGDAVGAAKWLTYYSVELPYIVETQLHGNGRQAIAGLSASGAAALNIAAHNPGKYSAVASLSGFTATSSLIGRVAITAMTANKGEPVWNLYGWPDDAAWRANDSLRNLDSLRGTRLYFYSATGLLADPMEYVRDPGQLSHGFIEFLARMTNDTYVDSARAAGLDVTYVKAAYGTHDWPTYLAGLYDGWNSTLGPALEL